ncbi:MAG: hypothetical protein FWG36_01715 [Oscillospiraceae bacterium]|nr:hypothetical protein [Oscillospiraceae bacterium]
MRHWRVGSLSMGLILIFAGAIMLISLLTSFDMLWIITTFWPVIMICLGLEIMLHLFVKKNDDVKIKYDVLSIIFAGFILIVSVCFYFVTLTVGMFDTKEDFYTAFGIRNETVYADYSVEFVGAEELVILDGINRLNVIKTKDKNIRVDYNVSVSTSDREYAMSYIDRAVNIEHGERAYMIPENSWWGDRKMGYKHVNCTVYLPEGKTLEKPEYMKFNYDSELEGQIINR